MKILTYVIAAAISLLPAHSFADNADVYSDGLAPGDSDSKWVVGAYALSINNIYKGADNINVLIPAVEYRGETFFIKNGELGAKLFGTQQTDNGIFSLGLLLKGEKSYLADKDNREESEALAGLNKRDDVGEIGMYFSHKTELGMAKVKIFNGIGDSGDDENFGNKADIYYTFNLQANKWHINPTLGVSWIDSDRVNHMFGVSTAEANANRSEYKGKSSVNLVGALRGRYSFNENWDFNSAAIYSKLGSGITDSSIVDTDDFGLVVVGTTYNF